VRLAALQIWHESNTFVGEVTTAQAFQPVLYGEAVRASEAEAGSTMAGFLTADGWEGVSVVPLLVAKACPSGTIAAEAFDWLLGEALAALAAGAPWDGVLLGLHGAAVSEAHPDADAEIAARVRAAVGPHVPIGLALDMHANITPRLIRSVTATGVYRTNPHVDAKEVALEVAQIVVHAARGEVQPVQALVQVPAVIDILRQNTDDEPMRSIMRDVVDAGERPGMLAVSVSEGYPYADVPDLGMAVVTVHDGDAAAARAAAEWLARRIWGRRSEFSGSASSVPDALTAAAASERRPVVLMDVGDNVGAGAPGDSTVILDAARRLGIRSLCMILFDPAAVETCATAGVGARVSLRVGAGSRDSPAEPVAVTATVRALVDGRFEDPGPTHGGTRAFDAGRSAVVTTTDGHTLLLTTRATIPLTVRQLTSAGIDPTDHQIVVAKGVQSPRPSYGLIAADVVLVDTPGVTAAGVDLLRYRRRRRPLYPFEPPDAFDDAWQVA
jgi:microcystin degradation protein MlrC